MLIYPLFSGRTHKESETTSDCQDFFEINLEEKCFAIADGASQSFYPSLWAEFLVNHFCENPNINQENWQEWLKPIQEKWLHQVKQKVKIAHRDLNPVWVTNTNRLNQRNSATSTFVGLQFLEDKIKVSFVGDSCLFIVKNNQSENFLLKSYPLKNSEDFDNRPEYFASYQKDNDFQPKLLEIDFINQKTSEKIYFVLATDALSEFILKCHENGKPIFSKIIDIKDQKDFEIFVNIARKDSPRLKNDDVALMILQVNDIRITEPLRFVNTSANNDSKIISNSDDVLVTNYLSVNNEDNTTIDQNEEEDSQIEITAPQIIGDENMIKKNRSLKLQRNSLLVLIILLSLLTYFLGRTSVNQDTANLSEVDTSLNDSNSPSRTEGNQNNSESLDVVVPEEPSKPKTPEKKIIEINTKIYKDEELSQTLIESTQTAVEASIIEKENTYLKIALPVYAHKSTAISENCGNEKITLKENIRIQPNKNGDLFGTLKEPSLFKNVQNNTALEWCKFEFEGYIEE